MDLTFTPADEQFRVEVRRWLESALQGPFAKLKGRGGPGDEEALVDERRKWEQNMAREGWTCLGWPEQYGGRGCTLLQEVIFNEEYARVGGPGRMNHIGETLLGPTLIAFGTKAQKERFLPRIAAVEELWCQGYSEPNAGSDLANVQTKATLRDDHWSVTGQKVWTSHAHWSDWCFVLCRTDPEAPRHKGISYLLVPMHQEGVEIRPIKQMTGTAEFSEVFFDDARTDAKNIVGDPNGGWKVAMGTLTFERGTSTLGQQLSFEREFEHLVTVAKEKGAANNPIIRDRLARAFCELKVMRLNALRTLSHLQHGELSREAMINKLYWATWHRDLGELAMEILGPEGDVAANAPYNLTPLQRLFLFTRADTIYAGSNQIQRNIIGERALGLPKEPRGAH
ncbi:MAG: acyl-CoA dehydrogenase family protein [Myxococcota bacterium]|nr:acyl-CoA dehydrogenase family protein [Myxococcota bacterium]